MLQCIMCAPLSIVVVFSRFKLSDAARNNAPQCPVGPRYKFKRSVSIQVCACKQRMELRSARVLCDFERAQIPVAHSRRPSLSVAFPLREAVGSLWPEGLARSISRRTLRRP